MLLAPAHQPRWGFLCEDEVAEAMALLALAWGTLTISAFFGIAQLIAGSALLRRFVRRPDWRQAPRFLGALAGIWLLVSGAGEVIVAFAAGVNGGLGGRTSHIRNTVDIVLLVVTALVLALLVAYPLVRKYAAQPVD